MSEQAGSASPGVDTPGWYPDPDEPGTLRWWDGSVWTDHRAAPTKVVSERSERLWAAASHLGVPFGSLITPTIVWSGAPAGSFRRRHARQAFSYQLVYLPFHIGFTFYLIFFGPDRPLLLCMLVGFVFELPQVVRALMGRDPYPVPPFQILKP